VFKAVASPHLVPFDGSFAVSAAATRPPRGAPDKDECKARLAELVEEFDELQQILYAHDNHAVLLVFQALDAAGKDSTIRAVLTGVNPAGCQVFSFKAPTPEELDHDFLWRTTRCLPERGRIGIFNRSYYEEVLVVRVHPEYLRGQKLPDVPNLKRIWDERFESIREFEKHLARSGTIVLKFWLNVSKKEQRKRFLSRLDEPEKNWKFNSADLDERARWKEYMKAYREALVATSRPWAPWYAIPADSKSYMRMCVADVIVRSLRTLELRYPRPDARTLARLRELRNALRRS
jgi:PPK2 family polyphosphate:nucleotide phosphotransferase